ncbi:MAG TPA: type II toxin-antitoxin system prevent-host-death family antitoxin [Rhizomicrobium sp.]|jgi:prevent-host-death family protein
MDRTVGLFEAKTHLSELVGRAEKGEEIVITKRGKAVAKLGPPPPKHDPEAARAALARIRARAKKTGIKKFDWKEWKKYVNEGRP